MRFRRIVLFQNGSIGDFLMALVLAEKLHPLTSVVEIIVPKKNAFLKELAAAYPFVSLRACGRKALFGFFPLLSWVGNRNAVVLPPTPGKLPSRLRRMARLLTLRTGSVLIGFKEQRVAHERGYTTTLPYNVHTSLQEVHHAILSTFGIPSSTDAPQIRVVTSANPPSTVGTYVCIHPRGSQDDPERSFSASDIEMFARTLPAHLFVVLTVSAAHAVWAQAIAARMPERIRIAAGLRAPELAELFRGAVGVIGVDTGMTHFAWMLGARTLFVAHRGTAVNWLPFGVPHVTVLYRLSDETEVRSDQPYLKMHAPDFKPFGHISGEEVAKYLRIFFA